MMRKAFYFILKPLFVLGIGVSGYVGNRFDKKA